MVVINELIETWVAVGNLCLQLFVTLVARTLVVDRSTILHQERLDEVLAQAHTIATSLTASFMGKYTCLIEANHDSLLVVRKVFLNKLVGIAEWITLVCFCAGTSVSTLYDFILTAVDNLVGQLLSLCNQVFSCQALRTSLVVILHISTVVETNASQLGAGCILVQTALFSHCLLWEPLDSELQVLDYLLQYEVAWITTLEELCLITCLEVTLIPRHITEVTDLAIVILCSEETNLSYILVDVSLRARSSLITLQEVVAATNVAPAPATA